MPQLINEIVRDITDYFVLCESINEMIDESLSISNNVENASYSILNEIKQQLPTKPKIHYDKIGISLKELYLDCKLSNTNIQINLFILYFKDKEDFVQKQDVIDKYFRNKTDVENNEIIIHSVVVNGYLDFNQLASTIQHELKHHYDEIMGLKSPSKDVTSYNTATNALQNKCSLLEYSIASIIYYANKYEISAFANGLYASLIQTSNERHQKKESSITDKELMGIVQSSDAYQYSMDMDKFINVLNNAKGTKELDDLLKKYKTDFTKITDLANYGKRNGFKQIGRAIVMYRNQQLQHTIIHNPKQTSAYYHINPFEQ